MNLANKITIARFFFIPVCVLLLLINNRITDIITICFFILACATDALDGYIARKKNLITDLGKFMDPLVDKLLVISILITLVELQKISCWIAIIIVWRELIITGFRLVAAKKNIVIQANYLGKIKTVLQMIMIVLVIFDFKNYFMTVIKYLIIISTVIFTFWSGMDYIHKNKNVLS